MLSERDKHLSTAKGRESKFQAMVQQGQQSLAVMLEESQQRVSASSGGISKHYSKLAGGANLMADGDGATIEASTASQLTMAIADFVHSSGLPFSVTDSEYFKSILKYARGVPSTYRPPNRNALATTLLKINFDRRMKR